MASRVLPRTIEVKHLAGNRSWGAAKACCQRTDNRGHLVNIRAAIAMGINQREEAIESKVSTALNGTWRLPGAGGSRASMSSRCVRICWGVRPR